MNAASALPGTRDFESKLDDIQSDLGRLDHLLCVTLDQLQDAPFVREDGSRIVEMDYAHSLLWIASDMARKLVADWADVEKSKVAAEFG